MATKKPRS